MNCDIIPALRAIPVAKLTREEWILVGMALKHEGFDFSVWDSWSRDDDRYDPRDCRYQWDSFHGSDRPVTAGTIIQLAKKWGWNRYDSHGCMCFNDTLTDDGYDAPPSAPAPDPQNPSEDLIRYLEVLFEPDEYVSYVSDDVYRNRDGRWVPGRGHHDRTAGELIASLRNHPDDLRATVGSWKEEAGAWIRFNPVDGRGIKNENITAFRFTLVECDSIPTEEQDALYRKLELPIAALVYSGGKSLHAIVHVDAESPGEYRQRVDFLYGCLEKHNVPIDKQNRNLSRLSRMPGVTRNGRPQQLIGVNIGKKNWDEWIDWMEGTDDGLPKIRNLKPCMEDPPDVPAELIEGILRSGHKMLVSGPSKAGKSFLLMELCVAIAEGLKWLGFQCRKGRVLYINLEIDPASAIRRFINIYESMGIQPEHTCDILVWNLRGHAVPLDQLVPILVRRIKDQQLDAIILDPIYKVITGDENSASEMGYFCNQIDKICNETGCSMIYCHHHSKGAQGQKKAMDRASGSGVFARDPDAQLDIIGLQMSENIENNVRDGDATPWRLESTLREFRSAPPREFWFDYPIHRVDEKENLKSLPAEGTFAAGRLKNHKVQTPEETAAEFRNAFYSQCTDGRSVSVEAMTDYMNCSDKTVYNRCKKLEEEFFIEDKIVYRRKGLKIKDSKASGKAKAAKT